MIDRIGKMKNLSDFQPLFFLQEADCTIGDNCRVGNWDGQSQPNLELGRFAIVRFPTDEHGSSLIPFDQVIAYFDVISNIVPKQYSVILLPDKMDIEFKNAWEPL